MLGTQPRQAGQRVGQRGQALAKGGWQEVFRPAAPAVLRQGLRPQAQHALLVKRARAQRTQVPADCELKLFASEPDIAKPIAFAWDERGRLWVACSPTYPQTVPGVKPSPDGSWIT